MNQRIKDTPIDEAFFAGFDQQSIKIAPPKLFLKERAQLEAEWSSLRTMQQQCKEYLANVEKDEILMQGALDFLNRVTHWQEGKPDLHDAKLALRNRLQKCQ